MGFVNRVRARPNEEYCIECIREDCRDCLYAQQRHQRAKEAVEGLFSELDKAPSQERTKRLQELVAEMEKLQGW